MKKLIAGANSNEDDADEGETKVVGLETLLIEATKAKETRRRRKTRIDS